MPPSDLTIENLSKMQTKTRNLEIISGIIIFREGRKRTMYHRTCKVLFYKRKQTLLTDRTLSKGLLGKVGGNCCSDVKSRSGIFKQVESSLVTFPQCLKIAKKGLSLECKQACFYLMMWCAKIQTNVGIFLSWNAFQHCDYLFCGTV